ncbi:TonB-dependent receptor [Flammeovirgaceae bacterium SG7u.111]|nr:TonB-dependent receptor [Flammeovirgaceae bacterium SG7u.132]WPO37402.1 TonB-dependent receptor [Flammeovirgaceae bacterium SG7u.111]
MKKNLLLLIFFLLGFFAVNAQTDTTTTIILEDVVIESNRLSVPFPETSRTLEVLTKQSLKNLPVQSVVEVLTFIPGVDIRQRGVMGVQADLSIRGSSFEQTLVLLNGMKMTDPQTGHHAMNLPMDYDNVEQIVVLKGPGARIYGQNAFAGAVNIITKVPHQRGVSFNAFGGDFGSYGVQASVALPFESNKHYISVSRKASDGYRHNTDFFINNAFYQSEIEAGNGVFKLQGGYTTREFGANGFYASPDATEQWEKVKTGMAAVAYETTVGNVTFKPRVYWRNNYDQYQFVRGKPEIYENIHKTNVYGAELNTSIKSKLGTTGLGVELRKEDINSSNLGDWERDNFGVFAEHRFLLGERFDMTPGVYVNWYSDYGWNAFPGIDMGYKISQKLRLYGNVGRSFRIPTYTDLYYVDPANQGNPDLKPEEALSGEIGLKHAVKGLFVQGNVFMRETDNLIDWIKNTPDDKWNARNITNLTTKGTELSAELFFDELVGENSFVKSLNVSYVYIENEAEESGDYQSRYALENIRNQFVAGLRHKIFKNIYHQFTFRYVDRVNMDNYNVADSRISWQPSTYMVYVEATNIFDAQYTEVNLVPMPGRWFRAGVKLNFGF